MPLVAPGVYGFRRHNLWLMFEESNPEGLHCLLFPGGLWSPSGKCRGAMHCSQRRRPAGVRRSTVLLQGFQSSVSVPPPGLLRPGLALEKAQLPR